MFNLSTTEINGRVDVCERVDMNLNTIYNFSSTNIRKKLYPNPLSFGKHYLPLDRTYLHKV